MSNPADEDTHPNMKRFKKVTSKIDPLSDRLLAWATASEWTPWLLIIQAVGWVGLGFWLAK